MTRRQAREKAVQALYQIDMRGVDPVEAIKVALHESLDLEEKGFLEKLVYGVLENQSTIDEGIKKYLRGWTLERLALVDRAVLRIAVYEIMYISDIPAKVSVNEALELARAFGMEESVKFINGVLANISKEQENEVGISE
ncbi:MAG TPA: transcription antitermination factor NusB [Bacillota bacterium]|nr:transcription antitermination factor NusB [Bacillota bacterium]